MQPDLRVPTANQGQPSFASLAFSVPLRGNTKYRNGLFSIDYAFSLALRC